MYLEEHPLPRTMVVRTELKIDARGKLVSVRIIETEWKRIRYLSWCLFSMFKLCLDFKMTGQTQQTISPGTFKPAKGHSAEMLMDEL